MGVFNSIYLKCKNCGDDIEVQSKADNGCGSYWHGDAIPKVIAEDINNCQAVCLTCGDVYRVGVRKEKIRKVYLY